MKINASEVSTYFVVRDFGLNSDILRVTDALDAKAGLSWAGWVDDDFRSTNIQND